MREKKAASLRRVPNLALFVKRCRHILERFYVDGLVARMRAHWLVETVFWSSLSVLLHFGESYDLE
jgi:hypothetical protein